MTMGVWEIEFIWHLKHLGVIMCMGISIEIAKKKKHACAHSNNKRLK